MTSVAPAHAPHRTIEVRLLTSIGWINGQLELLRQQGLREFLDSSPGIIKLQNVQLFSRGVSVPFFAIQKAAITFIQLSSATTISNPRPTLKPGVTS